jgi:hypothetical protein
MPLNSKVSPYVFLLSPKNSVRLRDIKEILRRYLGALSNTSIQLLKLPDSCKARLSTDYDRLASKTKGGCVAIFSQNVPFRNIHFIACCQT